LAYVLSVPEGPPYCWDERLGNGE